MNGTLSAELILGIRFRDLFKLILLLAYAWAILLGVKKRSHKQVRLLKILCAACAGMGIAQIIMKFTAPGNGLNLGLDYPCAALAGFWAGAYLGSGRQTERFLNYLGRRPYIHLIMITATVFTMNRSAKNINRRR